MAYIGHKGFEILLDLGDKKIDLGSLIETIDDGKSDVDLEASLEARRRNLEELAARPAYRCMKVHDSSGNFELEKDDTIIINVGGVEYVAVTGYANKGTALILGKLSVKFHEGSDGAEFHITPVENKDLVRDSSQIYSLLEPTGAKEVTVFKPRWNSTMVCYERGINDGNVIFDAKYNPSGKLEYQPVRYSGVKEPREFVQ